MMINAELAKLTYIIRSDVGPLKRRLLVALITQDVHCRDIVETLAAEMVANTHNFSWQQQLRFYWDDMKDDIAVRQINTELQYGYEYIGATSRLVITPLTDRCWITITGSLHIKLGT